MKINCPHCSQEYEIEESLNGEQVECQKCDKSFTVVNIVQPQKGNIQAEKSNGALYGCLICLIMAVVINIFSNFLFFFWIPLYLATFVLAIVSIAQRRVAWGIFALLTSIVAPIIISSINIAIGATVIHEAIKENRQRRTVTKTYKSNNVTTKPAINNSTTKQ